MTPIDAKRTRVPAETYYRIKVAAAEEVLTIEQMVNFILTSWLDERDAALRAGATQPRTPPRWR